MISKTVIKKNSQELTLSYGKSLQMNINPSKKFFENAIDKEKLIYKKIENSYIISLLNKLINKSLMYKSLLTEEYFFILCDRDGYIINLIYDDKLKDYFNKLHFTEGNSLRIEDCGTNAVCMAMEYKSQVELSGKDHYCDLFKDWYCTAIPIFDNYYRETIAYLDMSRIKIPNIREESIILRNMAIYIEDCITYRSEKLPVIVSKLDDTDRLILSLLARKCVRKKIILENDISESTLKRHLSKLSTLFNANNDLEIVMTAIKAGVIDSDGNILS